MASRERGVTIGLLIISRKVLWRNEHFFGHCSIEDLYHSFSILSFDSILKIIRVKNVFMSRRKSSGDKNIHQH